MTTLLSPPRSGSRASRHSRLDSLDGIRAIAVMLVLLFHVRVPGMHGGFLGVDVFFVLSGYLITTLLIREFTNRGRIDLGHFWLRRVLRLLPASLLVIAAVLAWGAVLAPSYRQADVGADAFWSLLYVGNWRFIASSGYFENDGTLSPLQHVWSLAVEEQFYIFWPLLLTLVLLPIATRLAAAHGGQPGDSASRGELVAVRRATARRFVLVIASLLGLASAILFAVVYDTQAPDRAYMGTDTRAFEPLLGAAAAAAMQYRPVQLFVDRNSQRLMVIGLGGIAVGVAVLGGAQAPSPLYFYGGAVAFSFFSVLLVAATSVADRRRGVALALGSTPMAYLGRISYGVYLWHWPLVLWLLGSGGFSPARSVLVIGLTVLVASASYFLIECPIRTGALAHAAPRRVLSASISLVAVVTLFAATLGGTPWNRVVPAVAAQAGGASEDSAIVIVGDSVIQRLLPALDTAATARGVTVTSAARGGCPALGVRAVDEHGEPLAADNCATQVPARQSEAINAAKPATVIWWSRYEVADRLDTKGEVLVAGSEQFWAAQEHDLKLAVDRLTAQGAELVIVEMDRIGIGMTVRCTAQGCPAFLTRLRRQDDLRVEWNERLRRYARTDSRVRVIGVDDLFCRNDATPCDDHLPMRSEAAASFAAPEDALARPDGSHFSDQAAPPMAQALLDRVLGSTGANSGN